jgi:type II secretory pathway pseudopilin PulG
MHTKRKTRQRGYILLEAMVGAALIGAALLGAYTNLGSARARGTAAMRQQMAAEVAMNCIEQARKLDSNFSTGVSIPNCQVMSGAPPTAAFTQDDFLGNVNTNRDGVKFVARLYVPAGDVREEVSTNVVLPIYYRQVTAVVWYPNPRNEKEYIPFSATTRIYERR